VFQTVAQARAFLFTHPEYEAVRATGFRGAITVLRLGVSDRSWQIGCESLSDDQLVSEASSFALPRVPRERVA
jgi:hypothetical protein